MTEAGVNLHMFDPRPGYWACAPTCSAACTASWWWWTASWASSAVSTSAPITSPTSAPWPSRTTRWRYAGPSSATCTVPAASCCPTAPARCTACCRNRRKTARPGLPMLLSIRDNERHRNDIEEQYLRALRSARQRLVVANAYFFPGYRLLRELRNAARRGVQVTLILQGQPDMPLVRLCSRLLYYLLRDGVVIHEYCQRRAQGGAGGRRMGHGGLEQPRPAEPVAEPGGQPGDPRPGLQPAVARPPAAARRRQVQSRDVAAHHRPLVAGATDLPQLPLPAALPGHRRLVPRPLTAHQVAAAAGGCRRRAGLRTTGESS